jgi:hypothetical protein
LKPRSSKRCTRTATAILVGGTLTQLMASMGTPWAFDPPHGCVLFSRTSASVRIAFIGC